MGSNFLNIPSDYKVYFKNNIFNYTHTKEQYVTNPKANILIDYLAYNLTSNFPNVTVATYMMPYGKGNAINLGIWEHILTKNSQFLKYFDNVIVPPTLDSSTIENNNKSENTDNFVASPLHSLRSFIKKMVDEITPSCNNPTDAKFTIDQIKIKCSNTQECIKQ